MHKLHVMKFCWSSVFHGMRVHGGKIVINTLSQERWGNALCAPGRARHTEQINRTILGSTTSSWRCFLHSHAYFGCALGQHLIAVHELMVSNLCSETWLLLHTAE